LFKILSHFVHFFLKVKEESSLNIQRNEKGGEREFEKVTKTETEIFLRRQGEITQEEGSVVLTA
jgi:hypothetical protein